MTVNSDLLDSTLARAVTLERLTAGERHEVLRILTQLERDLVRDLERSGLTTFRRDRLTALLSQARETIRLAYRDIRDSQQANMQDLADLESTWTVRALNTAIDVDVASVAWSPQQLRTLVSTVMIDNAPSAEWWAKQAGALSQRFSEIIRQGMLRGDSLSDLTRAVRGTRENGFTDGIMQVPTYQAEALIHSSISTVAQETRLATFRANSDVVKSVMWLSVLDGRTTIEYCIPRSRKLYTLDGQPIGHSLPWDGGPGRIHWRAICSGTLITTARGDVPIERVKVGEQVLTHHGRFAAVTACRSQNFKDGIIRIIHTESGRILRASDDHPVLVSGRGWKFTGAVKVGEYLFGNTEKFPVVTRGQSPIGAASENCPPCIDKGEIALKRAIQLVAPNVDFKGDQEVWSREVEDSAIDLILRDPPTIEDQGRLHYLLALAEALEQLGRYGFRNLLSDMLRDGATSMPLAHPFIDPMPSFSLVRALNNAGHVHRIMGDHAGRMGSQGGVSFFRESPRPMLLTGRKYPIPISAVNQSLFSSGSGGDVVIPRVSGKGSVRQVVFPFDSTERMTICDVFSENEHPMGKVFFGHDRIVALEVQTYNGRVFDLEVQGDCSYVASGIVVSNCRSQAVPVTKSWQELSGRPLQQADGQTLDRLFQQNLRDRGWSEERIATARRNQQASMNGQVSASLSYQDWFKTQGKDFQLEVLGRGRYDLYSQGKLTDLTDLVSQRGNPLTVRELKQQYGVAA